MSRYRFVYESDCYDDDSESPYPSSSTVEATHEFDSAQTWQCVLWQFCHFLEHIGFEGVRKNIKITDAFPEPLLFSEYFEKKVSFGDQLSEYYEELDRHDGDAS